MVSLSIAIGIAVCIGAGVFRRFLRGLALLPFLFSLSLFDLAYALLDVFLRVGVFFRREGLAVFGDQAADAGALVEGQLEGLALLDLHLAFRIELAAGDSLGVGVFLEQAVDLVLVLPDLLQQRRDVGQRLARYLRKFKGRALYPRVVDNLSQLYLVSLVAFADGYRVRLRQAPDGPEIGVFENARDLPRRYFFADEQSRRGVEVELDLDVLDRGQDDRVRSLPLDRRLPAEAELRFLFFVVEPSGVAVARFGLKVSTRVAGQRSQPVARVASPGRFAVVAHGAFQSAQIELADVEVWLRRGGLVASGGAVLQVRDRSLDLPRPDFAQRPLALAVSHGFDGLFDDLVCGLSRGACRAKRHEDDRDRGAQSPVRCRKYRFFHFHVANRFG